MCSIYVVHYELYNTLILTVFFKIILGHSCFNGFVQSLYSFITTCVVRVLGSYGNILTLTCQIHIERYTFCSFSSINKYLCFITTARSHTIWRLDRIKTNDNCLNRQNNILFKTFIENCNYPIHTSEF